MTYEGRKHLGKGAITQAMTLKIKDPFNEAKLQGDLDRIKAKYAEKGYVNTDISYELTPNEKLGTVDVKLIINEGERVRVQTVNLNGLAEIPAEKILKKALQSVKRCAILLRLTVLLAFLEKKANRP